MIAEQTPSADKDCYTGETDCVGIVLPNLKLKNELCFVRVSGLFSFVIVCGVCCLGDKTKEGST